jgi:hypothetical protein
MKVYPSCAIALLFLPQFASGAASFSSVLKCVTVEGEEFCATQEMTSPSPGQIDGELVYMGGWSDYFTFYKGIGGEGIDVSEVPDSEGPKTGLTTFIKRDDDDSCEVGFSVEDALTTCSSCTYCAASDNYVYDCSGLKYKNLDGASVTECTDITSVFFPFSTPAPQSTASETSYNPSGLLLVMTVAALPIMFM